MFRIFLLVSSFAVLSRAEDLPILGIIGGSHAAAGQFPFQISIEYGGRHMCGGSILSETKILTAAHCVYQMQVSQFTVLAGTKNRLEKKPRLKVASIVVHHSYRPYSSFSYDAAIITLQKPLSFSAGVIKPVDLPSANEDFSNSEAIVSGWGAEYGKGTPTTLLKYVSIPVWTRSRCQPIVPNLPVSHICAGDSLGQKNSCPGDSGGPLTIGNKQIGIVSFGFGCGSPYKPAMYTSVAVVREWIRQNAKV